VFWFGHIVTASHLLGATMVFTGLLLDLHIRYSTSPSPTPIADGKSPPLDLRL
jgi:hypothetical protein